MYVDLPVIASGSHVGLMDPHETILDHRDSKGARVTGKRFTMEEFRQYQGQVAALDGILGFSSTNSRYNGTLFRFPFRNKEFRSGISDRTYSHGEALRVLYDSLALEAHRVLLFLKHVTEIELYDGNPCTPGQLLRITVNSHEVQDSRAWYKPACTAFSQNQGYAQTYLNKCTVTVKGQLAKTVGTAGTSSWLMCSTIGVRDQEVKQLASQLKVIPWVGLAAPLSTVIAVEDSCMQNEARLHADCTSIESQVARAVSHYQRAVGWNDPPSTLSNGGFAFCFLPMSATTSTGLPVHIHGYFTLSDNRRRVRWPDADDNSDEANWNKHLVEHLIAPSYAILMTARCMLTSYQGFPLAHTTLQTGADPFALLPVMNECREEVWKHLIRRVQPLLAQLPVLWTAASNGMWVKACDAYFVPQDGSLPTSVVNLLLQLNCPIVCLPRNVQDNCTALGCKMISPDVVREYLRGDTNTANRILGGNERLLEETLRYLLSNGRHNLQDLPLVPLQQAGSVGTLSSQAFYVLPKNDVHACEVLYGLESHIVSSSLPSDLQAHFIQMAGYKQYSLQMANSDEICPNLLMTSIQTWCHNPNAANVTWNPGQFQQPPASWLSSVWRYIADNGKLHSVAGLPLVAAVGPDAVHNKGSVTLYPLKGSGSTVLRKTSASPTQMENIAEALGCTVVNDSHLYAPFGWQLNQYLPVLSSDTLFAALQLIPHVERQVAWFDDGQKRYLRRYLAEAVSGLRGSLNGQQIALLQSLPVYEIGIGNQNVTFEALNSKAIFPHHSISFPTHLTFPSQIVKVSEADQQLCQAVLQRPPLTLGAIVQQHIFYHAITQCDTAMRNQILLWVIQMSQPQYSGELEQFIRHNALIPDINSRLCRVDTLYDPEDSKLQEFFHSCEAKFPSVDFNPVLHKLRQFGLRTWHTVTHSTDTFRAFLQDRSQSVQFLRSLRMEKEVQQRSKLVLQAVAEHAESQYLLQCVQRQSFLFCQQSRPSGYNEELHWTGSGAAQLFSPSEVCASSDLFHLASLVGSVCPIIDNTYIDSVRRLEKVGGIGYFHSVSAEHVLQHFTNITSLPASALATQSSNRRLFGHRLGYATGGQLSVNAMVEDIYTFLSHNRPQCFLQWTPPCIWNSEQCQFVEKSKVALRPLEGYSLAPHRYSCQDLPCLQRHENMWHASGVKEQLTVEDGVQVVREIAGKSVQVNDRDLEVVVNVANLLKDKKEVDCIEDMHLPSKSCRLHKPKDLTYHDHYLDIPEEDEAVNFIHPRITSDVARFFGVMSLSIRAAPSQSLGIDYECTGPHESITHRIKELVEDYGDSIDVFKELIQNADDAGATEVKFLIDWRTHNTGKLLTRDMAKWQGPALYAYNNKTFSDEDLKNIGKVAGATKKQDHTKIGRFGVGFCATYHLTDIPSFITRRWLQVFDPHLKYLGDRVKPTAPGMQIDFVKEREGLKNYFSDQVAPYQGVFGCNVFGTDKNGFNGTLFRFPFRQQGIVSEVSSEVFAKGSKTVESLKTSLLQSADTLLLFLQNVNTVELFECSEGSSIDKIQKLFQITRTEPDGRALERQFRIPREHFNSVRPYSQMMKLVTFVGMGRQQRQEVVMWEVCSAMGRGASLVHANSQDGQSQGLVPVAEVAVRVWKEGQSIAIAPTQGTVSCFLPLPIQTNLNFVVNAFFDVSKDRRLLKGVQGSTLDTWNIMLIKDALVEAVFTLLVSLTKQAPVASPKTMEKFLETYYCLFPLKQSAAAKPDSVRPFLAEEFERRLVCCPEPVIWSACHHGCWLKPSDVVVLDDQFRQEPFTKEQYDMVFALLVQQHVNIAEVPPELRGHLRRIDFEKFCTTHFLGMIHQVPPDTRDKLMLFILNNFPLLSVSYAWLKGQICETHCIPCKPNGELCQPSTLVMEAKPLLANLFDECEGRFPASHFATFSLVLGTLGAAVNKLRTTDVSSRAKSVELLLETEGIERASKRSCDLVVYLVLRHYYLLYKLSAEDKALAEELSTIPFLPVMGRPADTTICWFGDEKTFACSKDLFHPKLMDLVFATSRLLNVTLFEKSSLTEQLEKFLPFCPSPNVSNVLLQLKCIIEWWKKENHTMSAKEKEMISAVTQSIYSNLCSQISNSCLLDGELHMQQQEPQTLPVIKDELNGVPFIWKDGFYFESQVFLEEKLDCPPYLVCLQEPSAPCVSLFPKLGVEQRASGSQLIGLLRQIAKDFGGKPVSDGILQFATTVATHRLPYFKEVPDTDQDSDDKADSTSQIGEVTTDEMRRQLYLPDRECVMRHCSHLMYMDNRDLKWLRNNDTFRRFSEGDGTKRYYLHPTISLSVAARLGIESPLEALLESYSDDSFMGGLDYGQCEDLCDRLNGILREYHADTSIFKEFVQNADDAGASEVAFVLDQRKFKTEYLFSRERNWQKLQKMPSLLIFNNRKFSDEDIKGITKLGRGAKRDTPETIGRFGIGFNVAYHVTDCPMFVSHKEGGQPEHFCVFDPNRNYAPLPARSPPGRRWELTKDQGKLDTLLVDQMEPYSEETFLKLQEADPGSFSQMSSSQKWRDGYVLFRLPLTRESVVYPTSRLTDERTTTNTLRKKLIEFSNEVVHTLLFLNSVQRISIFEISVKGECSVIGSCHVEASGEDEQKCRAFAQEVKEEKRKLKENQVSTLQTVQGVYQVEISGIQTELVYPETAPIQLSTRQLSSARLTTQTLTKISNSWIISKRFGGGDMEPNLLVTGLKHSFLPFGGIAAQGPTSAHCTDVSVHRPWEGKLFCYLPLPKSSCLPVHVNGHFWLNDSRRELQFSESEQLPLKDWNKSVCNDVICKAYAELLVYCRDVKTDKGDFIQDWYYKLYPKCCSSGFTKEFLLPEHLYCLLLDCGTKVLLALEDQASAQWLALTNSDGPAKGWFYTEDCELKHNTLLKLGIKLTAAPLCLADDIETSLCELSKDQDMPYTGRVTPAVLRDHLRSLCPSLVTYKADIVVAIASLLAYCLRDVDHEQPSQWKETFEDVPLMLTQDDELKVMCKVFDNQYADLLPQCKNVFVHQSISVRPAVHQALQKLGIIKPLEQDPLFVAQHLTFPRNGIVDLPQGDEFKQTLALFWKFFFAVEADSRDLFNDISMVPTTDGKLFPFSECKNIMFMASNMALIKMFCLPVVDFGCISEDPMERSTVLHCFANAENPDEIIGLLSVYKDDILQKNLTPEDVDVQELLHFLKGSEVVRQNKTDICWMKGLPLFKLVTGKLSAISSFAKAYDVSHIPHEGLAQIGPLTDTAFVIVPAYCDQLMRRVGVQLVGNDQKVLELYLHELAPCFRHLPTADTPELLAPHVQRLYQLSVNMGINKWTRHQWDSIFHILSETPFIDIASVPKCVKDLYDPRNTLLKECLPEDSFPAPPWDSDKWLTFLANMHLCSVVSEELWLQFARGVAWDVQNEHNDNQKCEEKARLLLEDLAKKMERSVQQGTSAENFEQFLCDAAVIKFIPCETQLQPCKTLQQALPEVKMPHQGWTTLRGSVLQVRDSDYQLACLYKPVLPKYFNPPTQNVANLKLLGVKSLELYATIAARNLVALTHLLEGCKELSFQDGTNTVTELHKLFEAHYRYLNHHRQSSVEKIVPILQNTKCILVRAEDGSTFDLLLGSQVVAKRLKLQQHEEMFFPLIQPVPDEFRALTVFLQMAGVADELEVSHCLFILRHVFKEGGQSNPNQLSCATAAYNNLVKLLREAEPNLEGPITECLRADVIPLLSKDEQLLPSTQLFLDDAQWYGKRVTPQSLPTFKLVLLPPKDDYGNCSLPACLGVDLLSSILTECPHPHMLHDKNACTKERRAAAEGKEHGCEFVTAAIEMLTSDDFFRGIIRIVRHENKRPPSDETVEGVEARLQGVTVKCLQVIKTVLWHKMDDVHVPNSENEAILCLVLEGEANTATVYIAPHSDLYEPYQLLHQLASGLNRCLGNIIRDNGLLVQMLMCGSPHLIDGVLAQANIPMYVHGSEQQPSPSKIGQVVQCTDQLDNLIVCTFRVEEIVKFCNAEGRLINAQVVNISSEKQNGLPACRLLMSLNTQEDSSVVQMAMSALVTSKYLYPQQRAYLASEWQVEVACSSGGAGVNLQPLSLLSLDVENSTVLEEQLTQLYAAMTDTFSERQVLHASIRLVHHLHFLCTKKNCAINFKASAGVLLNVLNTFVIDSTIVQRVREVIEAFLPPVVIPLGGGSYPVQQSIQRPAYGGGGGGYGNSVWVGYGGGRGRQYGGGAVSVWQSPAVEPQLVPNLVDAKMWLIQALNDYEAAKLLLEESKRRLQERQEESHPLLVQIFPAQVCFLAHESMEKCLKSLFLALFGLERRLAEHTNVTDLCKKLQENQQWFREPPVDLMPQVLVVSSHFLRCRYPEYNIPKMAPAEAYRHNFEEAEEAVSAVEKFLRTVRALPNEEVTQMFDAIDHSMPLEVEQQMDPNSEPSAMHCSCRTHLAVWYHVWVVWLAWVNPIFASW